MPQVLFYHFPCSPNELRLIEELVRELQQKNITSYVCLWRPHDTFFSAPTGLSGHYSFKRREWPASGPVDDEWEQLEWREAMFDRPNLSAHRVQLLRRAQNISAFQSWLLDAINPQLVIMWNGERTHHYLLRQQLLGRQVPSVRLERAPFPGLIYLSHDGLMAESRMATDQVAWNSEQEREEWSRRFDEYRSKVVRQGNTWWEQKNEVGDLRTALDIPENRKVVLFAAQVDNDTQNYLFSPFDGNVDAFRAFCRLCAGKPNLFILGKHHPKSNSSPEDFQAVLEENSAVEGTWVSEGNISECFAIADSVAAVNSSVLFEAALRKLPCLAMGQHIFSKRDVFYDLESQNDLTTVDHWLADTHKTRHERSFESICAWLLANHMYSLQEDDLRSFRDLADNLADVVWKCPLAGTPSMSPELVRQKTLRFFKPRLRARIARAIRLISRWSASSTTRK